MTSIVTRTTIEAVSASGGSLAVLLDVIGVGLLITLLFLREVMRSFEGANVQLEVRAFNASVLPLVVVFTMVIAVRFAGLLL